MMKEDAMWYDQRVEAFIDGELPDNESRLFAARLEIDPELKLAVDQALVLQDSLQSMPQYRCPPRVTHQVMSAIGEQRRSWTWIRPVGWAAGAAFAALMAIAINLGGLLEPAQPSADELAQARLELGIALAYLDRAGTLAGRQVSETLVTEGLSRPLTQGLKRQPVNNRALEDAS